MILGDFFFLEKNDCFGIFDPLVRFWYVAKFDLYRWFLIENAIWGHLWPHVGSAKDVIFFFVLPKLVENQKKHTFLVGFDHPHRIWGPTEKNVLDHFRPHKQKNHKIWCFVFCKNHFRPQKQNIKSVPGCQKSEKSHFFLRKKKSCKIVRFKS